MDATRFLIVNADDFGLSAGVNRGIIRAHEQGLVTSASLMVRWPAAAEAAGYARSRPGLGVGLHVDLGEWAYHDGGWVPVYEVVPLDDLRAVSEEVARQLDAFRHLVGAEPTHLDSHQHVHRREPVRSVVVGAARALGIPLRHEAPGVSYCGDFYGQGPDGTPLPELLTVDRLTAILAALPPGTTELCCHPGEGEGGDLNTMYRRERAREVEVLCHPGSRAAVAALGIGLRSFAGLRAPAGAGVGRPGEVRP